MICSQHDGETKSLAVRRIVKDREGTGVKTAGAPFLWILMNVQISESLFQERTRAGETKGTTYGINQHVSN